MVPGRLFQTAGPGSATENALSSIQVESAARYKLMTTGWARMSCGDVRVWNAEILQIRTVAR